MRLVTSEQMRRLDARTIELGTASIELMERAGVGVADRVRRRYPTQCRRGVLIVAGGGNNGGDGFVIARRLAGHGHRVRVALLADASRLRGDARVNFERWRKRRGVVVELAGVSEEELCETLGAAVRRSGLIVDAVFGTGLSRPVEGAAEVAIGVVNDRASLPGPSRVVVAVDLPSGLDGDRGEPLAPGAAVRADATYTLGAIKLGLVLPVALPWVGQLDLVEIGLAEEAFAEEVSIAEGSDSASMAPLVPRRTAASHKGTHGHLLIVAGGPGKSGAAVLAGRAALRAGGGLVTAACPADVQPVVAASLPEMMTLAVGRFSTEEWEERLQGKKAVVVGPGLGTHAEATRLVRWLVRRAAVPMVIDADGINAVAGRWDLLRQARGPLVLTPHPGEMARLCDRSTAAVQGDRRSLALEVARRAGAVVVLKGSGTLVAAPDGRLAVNLNGGPILGTAGTGDVLSGVIGSFLAQGMDPWDAARLGAFLHGMAADRLARTYGDAGLLASELADEIPVARAEVQATRTA